jgi:hypothetical protein
MLFLDCQSDSEDIYEFSPRFFSHNFIKVNYLFNILHLIGQLTFPIYEQFSLYLDNGITIPNDGTILEVKLFPAGLYFTGN